MSLPLSPGRFLSVDEYLRLEEDTRLRHEYVAGERFAMTGGTSRHNIITLNIAARLRTLARGTGCRVYANDMKVRVADDVFYYPDGAVQRAPVSDADVYVRQPCLIAEVTSKSSGRTDRHEKRVAYYDIASLQMYLVVQQTRRCVDVHARQADGTWAMHTLVGDGEIALACPTGILYFAEIYDGVALSAVEETEAEYEVGEAWY